MTMWLVIAIVGILWGCSRDGDGHLSAFPDGKTGDGWYIAAEIDSGRRVHAIGDSLHVHLKKIWMVSPCFLDALEPQSALIEDAVYLGFHVRLRTRSDILCPVAQPGRDTTLRLPFAQSWDSRDRLLLWGADSARVWEDSASGNSAIGRDERLGRVLDSVYLRRGKNRDTLFVWELDSLSVEPQNLPRLYGDGPWLYRTMDARDDGKYLRTYLIERHPPCALYNRTRQIRASWFRVEFWRELFVMDSLETRCLATRETQKTFTVWDVDSLRLVEDSAQEDFVLRGSGLWP